MSVVRAPDDMVAVRNRISICVPRSRSLRRGRVKYQWKRRWLRENYRFHSLLLASGLTASIVNAGPASIRSTLVTPFIADPPN